MSKTISLQQSVMQDVVALMDDNRSMKLLKKFLEKLKNKRKGNTNQLNDLREAFHELKLVKQGKSRDVPAEELLREL